MINMSRRNTKRKAFNFLRSYFDVLNELENDKDKLAFLLSIINKQFLDEDPKDLNFIVNLCYESQRHQIETSVNGWKRATKETCMTNPSTPLGVDPSTNPKEEKGEGQEKEEEKGEEEDLSFPPSLDSVEQYFIDNGYTKESAKKAFEYYNASLTGGKRKWTDSKGNVVKNWKQKMRSVWFKEENKVKPKASSDTFVNSQGQTINKAAW